MSKKFVPIEEPILNWDEENNVTFIMNVQMAILVSLEKRGLLTYSQRKECQSRLEKQCWEKAGYSTQKEEKNNE